MRRSKIRQRVALPLAAGFLVLTATISTAFHWYQSSHLQCSVADRLDAVAKIFESQRSSDAEAINALLDIAEKNVELSQAYLTGDRDRALRVGLPLFKEFNAEHRVTHFYLHDPTRTVFVRMHEPERHGDYIDRFTLATAVKTGEGSQGIELGNMGTFTLRVVRPWRVNGRLIGYLELGEEIKHFLPRIKDLAGVDLIVTVDKAHLDRASWEGGMRMLGRRSEWDRRDDFVVLDSTVPVVPEELEPTLHLRHPEHAGKIVGASAGSTAYRGGFLSLIDAGGRDVGDLIALLDVTKDEHALHVALGIVIATALVFAALASVVFWLYLGHIERSLAVAAEALSDRNAWLGNVVNASADGIVVIDEQGAITRFNPAAEHMFGWKSDDVVGWPLDSLLPEELREPHASQAEGYFAAGLPRTAVGQTIELTGMRSNGERFPLELSLSVGNPSGKGLALVVIRDVSARKKAEEELRQALSQLQKTTALQQAILDGSEYSIIATQADGTITVFNAGAERMLGYWAEEVVGKATPALFHDKDETIERAKALSENVGMSIEPGIETYVAKSRLGLPNEDEWTYVRKDGTRFPVLLSITPIFDDTGEISGFMGISQDITQRKRAEEALSASESRYRLLAENMRDVVWTIGGDMNRTYVSSSITSLTGHSVEEAQQMTFDEVLAPSSAERVRRVFERIRDLARENPDVLREPVCMEIEYRRKDGGTTWAEANITLLLGEDKSIIGAMGVSRDIAARKRAAEELQQYATKLEEANRQLAEANLAAQAASRAKGQFLANMSHELRTPLNGVIGMTELLRNTRLDDRQLDFVEACHNSGKVLLNLINDILDISKIEAGRLELDEREFDLADMVANAVATVAMQARQKKLHLISTIAPEVRRRIRGDDKRLQQILINLVGNAVKFTEAGQVSVNVQGAQSPAGEPLVRFEVSDTGIGIPADRRDRLFQSFSQADSSTTRKYGGTGLGLAISKNLIELMGGRIGVTSRPGRGSTFWFEVPLRPADNEEAETVDSTQATDAGHRPCDVVLAGRHVLLVEDNRVNRMYAQEVLRQAGAECCAVETGFQVLQAVRSRHFDLVLMDCQMPEMDGYEATRHIRAMERDGRLFGRLPIIALTANAIKGDREQCLEAGMDDYISKPFDPNALLAMMGRLLAANRSEPAKETPPKRTPAAETPVEIKAEGDCPNLRVNENGTIPSDADPTETPPSALMPIDGNALVARCMGNLEFATSLLEDFEADLPARVQQIAEQVHVSDGAAAATLAHALKGAAGTVAAEPLRAVALKIETVGKAGDLAEMAALIDQLRDEAERCIHFIPAFKERTGPLMDAEKERSEFKKAALA